MSISFVPLPPLVSPHSFPSASASNFSDINRRWTFRFRYFQYVRCTWHHGLQEILWQPYVLPPRRYNLCYAIWFPGRSLVFLFHCGQILAKNKYSNSVNLLDHWFDVSAVLKSKNTLLTPEQHPMRLCGHCHVGSWQSCRWPLCRHRFLRLSW